MFSLLGALVLTLLGVAGYLYLHGSDIVSPLPIKLGEQLQVAAESKGDADLKRLLKDHSIMYTSVTSAQDGYTIELPAKQTVLLSKQKDLASQISSLQVILPRLTMEGRDFRRLDLRYDKPVVTY